MSCELLFDVGVRAQIEVSGRDRAKFLHNFCTNDIKKLSPGQGCEAFVTNIQGKVLGHIFVFAESELLWIDSAPGTASTLLPHWERFVITEDVRFVDRSAECAEFLLFGAQAGELLERLGLDVGRLPLNGHTNCPSSELPIRSARRVDWFGLPTWLLLTARTNHDTVRNALQESGASAAGDATFQALRIEAGFPVCGVDITDENLAQEVGRTAQAISFTKGCYLGQEPIARIDAIGHVNRELRRLLVAPGPLPVAGTSVFDKPTPDGKSIGHLTSSAFSLVHGRHEQPIALAYIRDAFKKSGTRLFVADREATVL